MRGAAVRKDGAVVLSDGGCSRDVVLPVDETAGGDEILRSTYRCHAPGQPRLERTVRGLASEPDSPDGASPAGLGGVGRVG